MQYITMGKGTFKVEADGQDIIKNLLGDHYQLTTEFCRADAGYSRQLPAIFGLQIQNKFANCFKSRPKGFEFSACLNYKEMLLFCRPIGVSEGTLIIPGNLITVDKIKITLGVKANSIGLL